MSDCPFCIGPTQVCSPRNDIAFEEGDVSQRLLEIQEFSYLAAGVGAFVYPYVLFVTKRHITGIDLASRQERTELFELLGRCLRSGLFASGSLSLFEHGGGGDDSCSCLDHCHIHVVDGRFDLAKLLSVAKSESVPWPLDCTENQSAPIRSPYIWAGKYRLNDETIEGFVHPAAGLGQQYFRRLLAAWLRSEQWNWRLFPRWDNVRRLISAWPGQK